MRQRPIQGESHPDSLGESEGSLARTPAKRQMTSGGRRRRTREGPEPACVQTPFQSLGVAHAGREGRMNVLPWYRPVGVAKNSSESRRRKSRAAHEGQVAATWYGDDSLHLSWKCAQVTGKAGENGQNSGEMGGSSPWTRPSAPECGDTLKALAGGDRPRRRLRGRYRLGHRPVVLLRTETARCTVRPT